LQVNNHIVDRKIYDVITHHNVNLRNKKHVSKIDAGGVFFVVHESVIQPSTE